MKSLKKVIAVDIDEVIADFVNYFIYFHNLMYKTKMTKQGIFDYYLHKVLDIDREEMDIRFQEFQSFHLIEQVKPIKGSIRGIKELIKKGYFPQIITARPPYVENETKAWLDKHFKGLAIPIHFTRPSSKSPKRKKFEICKIINAKILIDDNLEYAYDCAQNGIKVILMDAPWNQVESLPDGIIRVKSWKEILEKIDKLWI